MYIYNVHKNEQKGTINMINGRNSCFYYAEISFRLICLKPLVLGYTNILPTPLIVIVQIFRGCS